MLFLLVFMIGLRHEVGGDWVTYLEYIESNANHSLSDVFLLVDPGFALVNWIAEKIGGGIYFANTVCASFFAWGLVTLCRNQPRAWLAMTVAVPYLVIVVAMGYTRQSVAIGFFMLGLVSLFDRRIIRFVIFIFLATTFHLSAAVLMPLAILSIRKSKALMFLGLLLLSILLYLFFVEEMVTHYRKAFLEAKYDSSGALIRLSMGVIAGGLFLFFRHRFQVPQEQKQLWMALALAAFISLAVLAVSPSSAAVDRLGLYLIPLQVFVFSRLPEVIGHCSGHGNSYVVLGVVSASALVQFIWLFFATHAWAWMPYQFYLNL